MLSASTGHPAPFGPPALSRHHGLDWLRIGAFYLLIFYHVGMYFVPWDWHVKRQPPVQGFTLPMLALYTWRLPLLFVVSGYASRALLGKLGGWRVFLGSRSKRLLIPLLFGMVVVVAPQPWVELCFKHHYQGSFAHFYLHDYFRFASLDGVVVPTWNHLWFVAYLWVYSLLLTLAGWWLPRRLREGGQQRFDRALAGARLLWMPIGWLLLVRLVLVPGRSETHGLFDDLPGHLLYLPCFLFGFGLAGSRALWPGVVGWWRTAFGLAVAGYLLIYVAEFLFPDDTVPSAGWLFALRVARVLTAWGVILSLLALAELRLNRNSPWRATLSEAVFPCYIIHQTVIVLAGWWLLGRGWSLAAEILFLIVVTTLACGVFYVGGRVVPWLRQLIGLKRATA